MARGIYEVRLKNRLFPALSEEDALEMQVMGNCRGGVSEEDMQVSMLVKEEHAMKLFYLAKSMYDSEKFEWTEVEAAVQSLAIRLGYYTNYQEVTDCVITWTERVAEDMTLEEFQEWLIG